MQNGSYLLVTSKFSFYLLFTKPLKYVIQWTTGSKYEHMAIFCNNNILNVNGEGCNLISLEDFKKKYKTKWSVIDSFNRIMPLTNNKSIELFNAMKLMKSRNISYGAFEAGTSAFQWKWLWRMFDTKKRSFCSESVIEVLITANLLNVSYKTRKYSPKTANKLLCNLGFYKFDKTIC